MFYDSFFDYLVDKIDAHSLSLGEFEKYEADDYRVYENEPLPKDYPKLKKDKLIIWEVTFLIDACFAGSILEIGKNWALKHGGGVNQYTHTVLATVYKF